MENSKFLAHAGVLSRSPLHAYITGPVDRAPVVKSSYNPYRKKLNLLSLISLGRLEEAIETAIDDQKVAGSNHDRSESPSTLSPLSLPG